jgi:transposase
MDRLGGRSSATAMLTLSPATRIFLAVTPIDGRKSFNGLTTLVKETLEQEPVSGFLFVFLNRARNRLKILFWDGSGLMLCTKRLEGGRFAAPVGEGRSQSLRPEELMLLLHGLEGTSRRQWHRV